MDKHIGKKLPKPAPAYHQYGVHGKVGDQRNIASKEVYRHINQNIESDEYKYCIVVTVPERSPYDVHAIKIRLFRENAYSINVDYCLISYYGI